MEFQSTEIINFTKPLSKVKILEDLLKEKDFRIRELENKLDSKAHLTYYNYLLDFIKDELLTIFALTKSFFFYYMKELIPSWLKGTALEAKEVRMFLSSRIVGNLLLLIYFVYIIGKYFKVRNIFQKFIGGDK